MKWSSGPPSELSNEFHKNVCKGDIAGMLELLEVEPRLVNSRNAHQETALMTATTHPDPPRALEMTNFLLERGAHLGLRDRRKRHVLIHACLHNADVAVVDTLLVWNAKRRTRIFRWNDRDSQGRTASVIASELENTAVTKLLLHKLDVRRSAKENHSFKVLQVAIESGNEEHALEVALHPTIQVCIKRSEKGRDVANGAGTTCISWCTRAALEGEMLELVQVLFLLNRRYVSRAVWLKIYSLSRNAPAILTITPPVLLKIGMHFINAWRWKQVRELCLACCGCDQDELEGGERLLPRLPEDVLHRIVAFVMPPAFQLPQNDEKLWCNCSERAVFGECETCTNRFV